MPAGSGSSQNLLISDKDLHNIFSQGPLHDLGQDVMDLPDCTMKLLQDHHRRTFQRTQKRESAQISTAPKQERSDMHKMLLHELQRNRKLASHNLRLGDHNLTSQAILARDLKCRRQEQSQKCFCHKHVVSSPTLQTLNELNVRPRVQAALTLPYSASSSTNRSPWLSGHCRTQNTSARFQ